MQALLDDLGSAESMYRSMYDTSKNSAGSAMRENEVFMKSLQARINLARVEVEKLAVAFGNAFLTEGMVQALTVFSSLTQALSGTVNFIGGLPVIFGAASTALLLLSTRFRGLLTALLPANLALRTYGNDQDRATAAATRAEKRANLASKAYRGLMLSLAGTLPIMVAMFAFEKLLSKISESRQRMEELESANKEMLSSYSSNATELDGLIAKYGELSEAMKYDSDNTQLLAEYRDVQNQIGNLMPSLVTGEDAYGNKIVETYEAMKVKTDLIKEQIALENEKKLAEERATRDEKIAVEIENLEDANKKISDYVEMLANGWEGSNKRNNIPIEFQFDMKVDEASPAELNSIATKLNQINGTKIKSDDVMEELSTQPVEVLDKIAKHLSNLRGETINSEDLIETLDGRNAQTLDEMITKLKEMKSVRDSAERDGSLSSGEIATLDIQIGQLEQYTRSIQEADYAQRSATANLKSQYISAIDDAIQSQSGYNDGLKAMASTLGSQLVNASTKDNIVELGTALESMFSNASNSTALDDIMSSFEKLNELDAETAESTLDALNAQIGELGTELEGLGLTQSEVEVIMSALDQQYDDAKASFEEISKAAEDQGISFEQAASQMEAYSEGMSESTVVASDLKETYYNLADSIDRLVGVSAEGVVAVSDLFFEYDVLTQRLEGLLETLRQSDAEFSNLTNQELIATLTSKDLTYEQQQLKNAYESRKGILEQLGQVFPDILAQEEYALELSGYRVEAARVENEANRVLGEAYQIMKDDVLTAEQQASFDKINQTNVRIQAAKSEIEVLKALGNAYVAFTELSMMAMNNETMTKSEQLGLIRSSHFVEDGTSDKVKALNDALNVELSMLDSSVKSFDAATVASKSNSSAKKSNSSATKDNTEAHKENTEQLDAEGLAQEALNAVTEKYTLTLEKLANAQKKVQNNQKKYSTYSKKYRDALAEENKLIQQQIELNKSQASELEALNGKTFNAITYNSDTGQIYGGNNPVAIKNGKLQGWQDVITDVYGSWRTGADGKKYQHTGIDLDGKIGDALAANVRGKVVKTSDTGNENGRSGKFVQILDENGIKHHYGHLNKVMVAVGQLIEIGEQIGEIGNTGNVKSRNGDGSHLHYEVWGTNGKNFNPIDYVNKAKNQTYSAPTQKAQTVNVNVNNSSSKATGNSTQDQVWNFLLNKGLSSEAAAGIMGNIQMESGFKTNVPNPSSGAYGLVQWLGVRKKGLQNYASQKGTNISDLQTQLEYLWKELNSTEKKTLNVLQQDGKSVEYYAERFDTLFERSEGTHIPQRQKYANQFYSQYGGSSATATSAASVSGGIISNGYYTEETTHTLNTLADIEALRAENEELANQLQENYYKSIQSKVEEYEYNRAQEDIVIAKEAERQELMDTSSKEYEESLNKQFTAEQRKIGHYEKELAYIKAIRQAGGLTDLQSDQLGDRIKEIETAIMESTNAMNAYYYDNVASHRERYEKRRSELDNEIARQDARQANLAIDGASYENSVNKQYSSEKKKLDSFQEELRYLQKLLAVGKLTEAQSAEIKEAIYEIQIATIESDNAIKEYYSKVVEGYLARFNSSAAKFGDVLDWEETKIKSVNVSSDRYNKTLQKMVDARKGQIGVTEKELAYAKKQLASGELTSDMYSTLSERVKELKKELIDMNEELHQTNYELIQTEAILNAREIDDIDFTSSKNDIIMGMFDEDSADRKKHMMMELMSMSLKLKELEQNEEDIQFAMRGKDIGHDELEKLEEQLEENALAYWTLRAEIRSTEKALEDFNKQIEEKVKEKYGQVADYILDALKDAYEERKKIAVDAIEKEIKAENERHEKIMKQYDDELEMYNKITNAKLRELDDKDRDRTHNMNIEELTDERAVLQNRANLLSTSTQYADRKEREDLLKQIADIDKQIAEENYNYSLELQKQELNDRLEERTEHIEDLQEKEDKQNEETLEDLETRKEYWEKYYDDIINDEERWYNLREDMLKGNFDEVVGLINENIDYLKPTVADLGLEMDGVWQNVGKSIRENVIWELENMLKELAKVKEEVDELNNKSTIITSGEKGNTSISSGNGDEITEANLKVILAKFMNEQIAGKLDPNTQSSRIKNIKEKASTLAAEGRAEGGNIEADKSLREIFDSLNVNQINQVGDYFTANASESGFITQEYLDYINEFGKQAQGGNLMTTGDMQVLMAKYMKEKLANETKDTDTRNSVRDAADALAKAGRDNTSFISPSVGYDVQVRKLSEKQRQDFGDYLSKNSAIVADGTLRSSIEDYAKRLQLTYSNEFIGDTASMDKGGMTKSFGSSGGVDGKGGRFAIIHENELVSSPVDTKRLLNTASIMDNIFSSVRGMISKVSVPFNKLTPATSGIVEHNTIEINVNIDKFTGTKSALDSLGKEISNRLYVQKGKK